MKKHRWRTLASAGMALGAVIAGAVLPSSGASADTSGSPLEILLTNDDGVNGGYINIVRDALCEAGHRVTIVAPSGDQSGNSSRFTSARDATLRVATTSFPCGGTTGQQHSVASEWTARLGAGGTYRYEGPASPVDSIRFALSVVYAGDGPDVVISGANPGQNLSSVVLKSGTVGAALAAAAKGIPAVALSVAFNPADSPQTGFPAATSAARGLSDWTVRLLDRLQETRRPGAPLLAPGLSLNVNYPTPLADDGSFAADKVGDAVLTVAGERDLIPIRYVPTATPGEYRVSLSLCGFPGSPAEQCDAPEVRDADTTAIDRNLISVQPMDGDVTVSPPASTGLQKVLNRLNG
jgi:5'-nucleotidase